ncbi:MAG: DUF4340 domain-containing protein [Patescibacteria group bacterium]|jgi:hypothetical protein
MPKKYLATYILLGCLALLAVAVYIIKVQPFSNKEDASGISFYSAFNKDNITKIEIINSGQTVTLTKESDKWMQDGVEAKTEDIDSIFTKTADIKVTEPITDSADKLTLFQVDGSALTVKMYAGEQLIYHFYIGKNTPDYNGNYIRKEGENKVYAAEPMISYYFTKDSFAKEE